MPAPRGLGRAMKKNWSGLCLYHTELSCFEAPPPLLPPDLGSLESATTSNQATPTFNQEMGQGGWGGTYCHRGRQRCSSTARRR